MNTNQPTNRTRTGKIARLPQSIRAQLNQRLRDGQPGSQILPWLNELPQVQQILHELFADQPISDRNLTSWRQGGFRDDTQQHTQTQRLKELSAFAFQPVGRRCPDALTSPDPTHFIQGALTLVTAQIFELLQTTDTPDLNQLITLIKTLTRLRSTEIARQNADLRREQIQLRYEIPTSADPSPEHPQPTPFTPPQPLNSEPRPHLNPPTEIETLLRLFTAMETNLRQPTHASTKSIPQPKVGGAIS